MRILAAYDAFSACAWYRLVIPLHHAKDNGHEVRLRQGGFSQEDLDWCDTLLVQRLYQDEVLRAVLRANRAGKHTVYDLDDDLWCIGPDNCAAAFWNSHNDLAADIIAECQTVTTTGTALAKTLRKMNPNVKVIPNALPTDWQPLVHKHDGVNIGWAGSVTHIADLSMVATALTDTLEAHPDATLLLAGAGLTWVQHERVRHLSSVPIERYHQLVSTFDIGIAPIEDTRFNRAKSDLKVTEYAGLGIPFVASNVGPYKDSVPHGDVGYLANGYDDWRAYLDRLITDTEHRKQMGERGKAWARYIPSTLPLWEDAWARNPRSHTDSA